MKKVEPKGASGIVGLLKVLEDMENNGVPEGRASGEIEGPFFSRALFGCKIKLGLSKCKGKIKR